VGDLETAVAGPEALVHRVQELLVRLDEVPDPNARAVAQGLLGALMDLYGEGLERIFRALAADDPHVSRVRDALVEDGVVASLLLVHGLYPVDLETRVRRALDGVRPYMHSHGGDVTLVDLDGGVATLRLEGSCDGCRSSAQTLELAIRQALDEAAPDLEGIEVEGVVEPALPAFPAGKQLPLAAPPGPRPVWTPVDGLERLGSGERAVLDVDGARLLVANVDGTLLAYLDACAGCGEPIHDGGLESGVLACPSCGRRFELPRAGRACGGHEELHLTPVPLLPGEGGRLTVAVA
jgi:Fe-S cluster biogenesis protein NfuA